MLNTIYNSQTKNPDGIHGFPQSEWENVLITNRHQTIGLPNVMPVSHCSEFLTFKFVVKKSLETVENNLHCAKTLQF